ncbi:MerR family transcriptional regulator [Companilactobacillus ginsenosidimutans]|uniref:HTH merR-type domain-containing protein n=1 Tax=Companilactobacillus ginsenosidimutans TaxID=1007676 RepID=A0A0H4QHJ0_9LACO|nr:MerR family transcriptional regulator [Companilactobacillus ginsenosidimutans]AKP67407.1 hypothetical protein ABM34_07570 [Companilactobacillus ginsenosidimutans]
MKKDYLSIGQMSAINNVSTQALRLYDKNQLLSPAYQDPENGYRYYTIAQCDQLDLIHTMQVCGMTLEQIKKQFSEYSPESMYQSLLKQENILSSEIEKLNRHMHTVKRLASNLNKLQSLPPDGQITMEYLPSRRIDTLKTDIDLFDQEDFGYEIMLRKFKLHMLQNKLPLSYFVNAGTIIKKDDFANENFHSNTIFIFVDNNYPKSESQEDIPENTYLTLYGSDTKEELSYAQQMFSYIKDHNFKVIGDYVCEVIFNSAFGEKSMKYKIQVPIRKL